MRTTPDAAFDGFAAREPYFAVVTDPKFLRANLTPAHEREFFATGETLVNRMFAIIEAGLLPGFAMVSMLECGCGLGRLPIPFSRRARLGHGHRSIAGDARFPEARGRAARSGPHRVRHAGPAAVTATDAEIDTFNRSAEAYYATLSNWNH